MKLNKIIITLSLVLTISVTISYSLEELLEYPVNDQSSNVRLSRVKRKGGRGGGGRGGSRGGSRGSSSKSKSRVPPSDPYPKQPAYNPNYNPSAPAYPKQPGQHANYPGQQQGYPGQTGQNYPGQAGHNYPGQTGYGQGQSGYPQAGYGQNYGKTGGLGGIGGGLGGSNFGKSKSGLGGALGAGLAGGALGAAAGAYGGYKLGNFVGGLGRNGHYGYYNDQYRYIRCDPPPKIEFDPETNKTYIPISSGYDKRCEYYDREPPRTHPYYNQRSYYMNGSQPNTCPSIGNTLLIILSVFVFCFDYRFISSLFRPKFLPQI